MTDEERIEIKFKQLRIGGKNMAKGFWTKTPQGQTIHIKGDPNMSEETVTALGNMMDLAAKEMEQLRKDFEQLWKQLGGEGSKQQAWRWFERGHFLGVQRMREIQGKNEDGDMRQYKFRYYIRNNGLLGKFEYTLDEIEEADYFDIAQRGAIDDELIARCQYTGWKDREGNEIYEGDIVEYSSFDGRVIQAGVVTWIHACFNVRSNNQVYGFGQLARAQHGLKVVGNVYENPEMVEGAG